MYDPEALRLFFLSSHYRSPLFYSEENVRGQERAIQRLRQAVSAESTGTGPPVDHAKFKERFIEAMGDDLNTPRALAALFDLAREINRGRERGANVKPAQEVLAELAGVLGLTLEEPTSNAEAAPFIQMLIDVRVELRSARQFQLADKIRDQLTELGVTIEDSPSGTNWRVG